MFCFHFKNNNFNAIGRKWSTGALVRTVAHTFEFEFERYLIAISSVLNLPPLT